MDIPKRAIDRPVYNGLLVPYTVKWFDGVPDFKITDPRKARRCITERRCGLCGRVMSENEVVFIGGEGSMQSRLFTDPAMHEECARYAYSVCPFLSGKITEMAPLERYKTTDIDMNMDPKRPKRFGLLFTRGWTMVQYNGEVYIRGNAGRIEWLD